MLRHFHFVDVCIILLALVFGFWIMYHTFSYKDYEMHIAAKAWSDFGGHIPLIRSFSFGANIPTEYPLFPGEPIKYHFLFYMIVGYLEKMGLPIDYALNIPSALSFALLIIVIYFLGTMIFKNRSVGVLAVLFFLFNSSLSFLEFLKTHPLSLTILQEIVHSTTFPSFGPYDGKVVSAFWNLNIYTNQRHFALSLALFLFIIFYILKDSEQKKFKILHALLLATFIGILPYLHSGIFIILYAVLGVLFVLLAKSRLEIALSLILGGLLALPRILLMQSHAHAASFKFHTGFLATDHSLQGILYYWILNLGLSFLLIPIGVVLAPKLAKKLFVAILPTFFIGNLFVFGPDISANHKFFTFFIIIGNMFSAYALIKLWSLRIIGKILFFPLLFFMTLSGIIDFFPIKNDAYMTLPDYPKNQDIKWIVENTPKDALFLNTTFIYHPASIAGRKIFLGWPYFPWSLGYDATARDEVRKRLLYPESLDAFCKDIRQHDIAYVSIQGEKAEIELPIKHEFFDQTLPKLYENTSSGLKIYSSKPRCLLGLENRESVTP